MEWIGFDEQMPKEEVSMFAKYYGTPNWHNAMFKTCRDNLLFTIEANGTRIVVDGKVIDGVPICDYAEIHKNVRYIAWMPYPKPF